MCDRSVNDADCKQIAPDEGLVSLDNLANDGVSKSDPGCCGIPRLSRIPCLLIYSFHGQEEAEKGPDNGRGIGISHFLTLDATNDIEFMSVSQA